MKTRVIPNGGRARHSVRAEERRAGDCPPHLSFKDGVRSLALLGMTAWFAWLLLPKPPLLDGISFSQIVRDRNGKLLRVALTSDQKFRIWTPLSKISPDLVDATLRYEDKYYLKHLGVN